MDHFAGFSYRSETSVCIVDDTGGIVREVKVASEPEALLPVLTNPTYHFKRIDWKPGRLAMAVQRSRGSGLAMICVETRHMRRCCRRRSTRLTATTRGHGADDAAGFTVRCM